MKQIIPVLLVAILFSACGKKEDPVTKIATLKKERADIDIKIRELEAKNGIKDTIKSIAVAVTEIQPQSFQSFISVQASIKGDQDVIATPQMPGTVRQVMVHAGQHVNQGQVLAMLDAASVDQQIAAQDAQLSLLRTLYEKQQKLWAQQIGTEVQLLSAKANYEAATKQRASVVAQRNMARIVAPISGTVDVISLKEGEMAAPAVNGIHIVNASKLKAEASLGESYLGKVQAGNPVTLLFADNTDSLKTRLDFVSQSVDPLSRAFKVQINLGANARLHPNMSAQMRIANYSSGNALVVPVNAIQKTAAGEIVFVAEGNKARSVPIVTGRNGNGTVEVLSGLKAGDKVVIAGYEDLESGTAIKVQ